MSKENMKNQLSAAVRGVQWSYAIFWSPSSQQSGVLEWGDGYYNGGIKTRRTIQSTELLNPNNHNHHRVISQRSDQLRELYLTLLTTTTDDNDTNNNTQIRRPLAALSPEDLTEVEWFYLVCMSFVFHNGQGLPGRSAASGRTIWLSNAHCCNTKVFARSLLAQSAGIQTVVCFPYLTGVIELGVTDLVEEDLNIIQHIRAFLDPVPVPAPAFVPRVQGPHVELLSPRGSSRNGRVVDDLYLLEGGLGVYNDHDNNTINPNYNIHPSALKTKLKKHVNGAPNCDIISSESNKNLYNKKSSFVRWEKADVKKVELLGQVIVTQGMLKKMLFEVPLMHNNGCRGRSTKINKENNNNVRKDEFYNKLETTTLNANHVLAERRRREKVSERFSTLKSLIPTRSKADKISILDDTITYLKELERRVEELGSCKELTGFDVEKKKRKRTTVEEVVEEGTSGSYGDNINVVGAINNKRSNSRIGKGDEQHLGLISTINNNNNLVNNNNNNNNNIITIITINMVDKDNLIIININCPWRESLLLEIIDTMSNNLHLDSQSVQSSTLDGVLSLKIQSKVKGSTSLSVELITETLLRVIRTSN